MFQRKSIQNLLFGGIGMYAIVVLILIGAYVFVHNGPIKTKSSAQQAYTNTIGLSTFSQLPSTDSSKVLVTDIFKPQNATSGFMTSSLQASYDIANVYDLMKKLEGTKISDSYLTQSSGGSGAVFEQTSDSQTAVLPKDFSKHANLVRSLKEEEAYPDIAQKGVSHYYFEQKIPVGSETLPVYGSHARLDVQKGPSQSDMVGLGLAIVKSESVLSGSTSQSQAESAARQAAASETSDLKLVICPQKPIKKMIVNELLLGTSTDDTSKVVYKVSLCTADETTLYDRDFYVSTVDGKVLFSEENIKAAMNRQVKDCSREQTSCILKKREGDPENTQSTSEVEKTYVLLHQIYDYYFNQHKRDSWNGAGAPLYASVGYKRKLPGGTCPNAVWTGSSMHACQGLVTNDIWAHEITHGVTQSSAGLCYNHQCGALNEGFSDVFGWANDQGDWTLGEEYSTIRRFDDPPRLKQPDKVTSSLFSCSQSQNVVVHTNSGIFNKAFYLMVAGGTFNGCTIQPVDSTKVLKVMYKTLTTYLKPQSNFKDAYLKVNQACAELYGASSADCNSIANAMQATEMHKIKANDQIGPSKCGGQLDPNAAPICSGTGATGGGTTGTPYPTTTQPLPTTIGQEPTPTSGVANRAPKSVDIETCTTETGSSLADGYKKITIECFDGRKKIIGDGLTCLPIDIAVKEQIASYCATSTNVPSPTPTISETQRRVPEATATPIPVVGTINLTLTLRLQGVTKKPQAPYDTTQIKVGILSSKEGDEIQYKSVTFTADAQGLWHGTGEFRGEGGKYVIFIKGPQHIQEKICHQSPSEARMGEYRCENRRIELKVGTQTLDFSGVTQLACDLPEQDGVCNALDISRVQANLNSSNTSVLPICDINRDGVCNSFDHSFIIKSLSIHVDED